MTTSRRRPIIFVAGAAALLAVAAGTGATAATLITGADIKDGTVTSADIQDGTLKSVDVADGTLKGIDLKDGTVQSVDVANGSITGADVGNGSIGAADLAGGVTDSLAGGRIPSGRTVTGTFLFDIQSDTTGDYRQSVDLPGAAGKALADADINFAADGDDRTSDDDATCTGTSAAPTAPAGKVCLYFAGAASDIIGLSGWGFADWIVGAADRSFAVVWQDNSTSADVYVYAVWAYTAP